MREPNETAPDQFHLRAMFEVTAACGLFFAVLPYRELVLFTLVFTVLAAWAWRVPNWPLRMSLIVWLGGLSLLCLGLACIEQAIAPALVESRQWRAESLVFFGTMTATLGAIAGVTGLAVLLVVIGAARRPVAKS